MLRPILLTTLAIALSTAHGQRTEYDPMRIDADFAPKTIDFDLKDKNRDRTVPIRVYLPKSTSPAPVVFFSHGLGGARTNNAYIGNHLAARGYVCVFTQHIGSDESVWKGVAPREVLPAMRKAASGPNFVLRNEDIQFVLDELERMNKSGALKGRLNLEKVGMSGHSFGAVTTQAVSGQFFPVIGQKYTDKRIDAAVMYSPSAPPPPASADRAFGSVTIPWLLMTGTEDTSPINDTSVQDRLNVYPALPKGNKYELVLDGAQHSAFSERALRGESQKSSHHRTILALTTAFWDAYLIGDAQAKSWLNGDGPKSVLDKKDRWRTK